VDGARAAETVRHDLHDLTEVRGVHIDIGRELAALCVDVSVGVTSKARNTLLVDAGNNTIRVPPAVKRVGSRLQEAADCAEVAGK
jgi:hypothetical protein